MYNWEAACGLDYLLCGAAWAGASPGVGPGASPGASPNVGPSVNADVGVTADPSVDPNPGAAAGAVVSPAVNLGPGASPSVSPGACLSVRSVPVPVLMPVLGSVPVPVLVSVLILVMVLVLVLMLVSVPVLVLMWKQRIQHPRTTRDSGARNFTLEEFFHCQMFWRIPSASFEKQTPTPDKHGFESLGMEDMDCSPEKALEKSPLQLTADDVCDISTVLGQDLMQLSTGPNFIAA
ncbi:hypothetical protein WISP_62480 [Willisornis vidua]|uniref:Uncharacterized protein n=1 Tax=Willisornis vidua TaxID=1566151 RepID=A0ABQ9DG52_9PASS|nr:hypothetical protein WISP_62480 [Willisornis vidua]